MDLNAFLNNPGNLAAMAKALNSPEGQRLRETLKNTNKKQLGEALGKMGINNSMSPEELKRLAQDPNIISRINELLKG